MYSLLIDTHDIKVTYVLYKDGKVIDLKDINSNMRHSEIAMPTLIDLISSNNLEIKDIKELLVVVGPGSFTGVRIGVVIAKTIAYILDIPIKPLTSLDLRVLSNVNILSGNYKIDEKNGYFVGKYDSDGKILGEIQYFGKKDLKIDDFVNVDDINYENIYIHMRDVEPINPHLINPVYVKQIEALKND